MVHRKTSERDLRQLEFHLTEPGERQLEQLAQIHRDDLQALTELLSNFWGEQSLAGIR